MILNTAIIDQVMVEFGYGVREACAHAGIGHKTLQLMRQGKPVSHKALHRFCKAFDIVPRTLIIDPHAAASDTQERPRQAELVHQGRQAAAEHKDQQENSGRARVTPIHRAKARRI